MLEPELLDVVLKVYPSFRDAVNNNYADGQECFRVIVRKELITKGSDLSKLPDNFEVIPCIFRLKQTVRGYTWACDDQMTDRWLEAIQDYIRYRFSL